METFGFRMLPHYTHYTCLEARPRRQFLYPFNRKICKLSGWTRVKNVNGSLLPLLSHGVEDRDRLPVPYHCFCLLSHIGQILEGHSCVCISRLCLQWIPAAQSKSRGLLAGYSTAFPPRSFPPISLNSYSWHADMMHHLLLLSEREDEKR